MSAHETVSGQISSSCCLISSMTLNPRAEFKFGVAVFSPTKPGLSSSKLEPSQPCCFPQPDKQSISSVMEMEPQQGRGHARVVLHGCVHSALYNGESIWAAQVVEGNVELCSSYVTDRGHG